MNDIISPPSKWVSEMITRIEPGGTLIDIACGRGRHSIEFSKNFFIYSVDKNNEFLNNLKNKMNIKTICQDLENQEKWSFSDKKFNVVLVTNYLFREKLNAIFSLVDLYGYIIYETFAIGNEKYGRPSNPNYLLKKNVKILSDNFILNAKDVKIDFDKSLYDITEINAKGEVNFISSKFGLNSKSEFFKFEVITEKLRVDGKNSELISNDIEMYSDGFIEVNNLTGDFKLEGLNSKLINESILIKAEKIDGIFSNNGDQKEITFLNVIDKKISYVKNNNTEMYAKKINFKNCQRAYLIGEIGVNHNRNLRTLFKLI